MRSRARWSVIAAAAVPVWWAASGGSGCGGKAVVDGPPGSGGAGGKGAASSVSHSSSGVPQSSSVSAPGDVGVGSTGGSTGSGAGCGFSEAANACVENQCIAPNPMGCQSFWKYEWQECGCRAGAPCGMACGASCMAAAPPVAGDPCGQCLLGQISHGAGSQCTVKAALVDCSDPDCRKFIKCAQNCG